MSSPHPALLLLLLAMACGKKDADGNKQAPDTAAAPEPPRWWTDLTAAPLSPFLPLLSVPLPQADLPTRLQALPARSLVFVADTPAVWVLDSRYRHDPEGHCVSADEWPDLADTSQRQGCDAGSVRIQRGALTASTTVATMAVDPVGLAVVTLDEGGRLWWHDADILRGNPLDHLRPVAVVLPGGPLSATARVAVEGRNLVVAEGTDLRWLDLESSPVVEVEQETLPTPALDVSLWDGVAWIRTDAGLLRDGVLVDGTAGVADVDRTASGGVVLTLPADDAVLVLDSGGSLVTRHTVAGLRGPVAADPGGERLYVVTDAGLAVVGTDAAVAGDFQDVTVSAAHEVVALSAAGSVEVYGDDEALAAASAGIPPVALMAAAFVERPRSPDSDVPCRGEGSETVQVFAARVVRNAGLLDDLPAAVALGVTPHFARRAQDCEETAALAALADLDHAATGVLFHQLSGCDSADLSCEADFLRTEADALEAEGLAWTFSSGLSTRAGDWVAALRATDGQPGRYLFFGMSILPDLGHDGDPRAKDAWPVTARASAWPVTHTEAVGDRTGLDTADALVLYPGDNLPAFNLGGCANLLLRECHLLGNGTGQNLSPEDGAVLLVLARRAVAERTDARSAWSFHLPDLGVYDYTDDESCARGDDGLWSGDDGCEAVTLQTWAHHIHTHYVLQGLARWASPADLEP